VALPDGVEERLTVPPSQAGPSLAAVIPIVDSVKVVVLDATQPKALVTVTEYVPFIAVVAPVSTGAASVEVKPPGPVHE